MTAISSGGSRISRRGDVDLQRGRFWVKMYAKTKELGPVRRACAGHSINIVNLLNLHFQRLADPHDVLYIDNMNRLLHTVAAHMCLCNALNYAPEGLDPNMYRSQATNSHLSVVCSATMFVFCPVSKLIMASIIRGQLQASDTRLAAVLPLLWYD